MIPQGRRGIGGRGFDLVPEGVGFECVGVVHVYFAAGGFHHVVATDYGGCRFVGKQVRFYQVGQYREGMFEFVDHLILYDYEIG